MRLKQILFYCVVVFLYKNLQAQDSQFSQYYAAPMYLNPGLVGIHQKGSFGVNYRNQWPNIDAKFETYSFYVDNHFEDEYMSVGLIFNTDREGIIGLQSNTVGLQYAYQLRLNPFWTFRPGMEVSYFMRDLNFNRLTFGDQFDENGLVNPSSSDPVLNTGVKVDFFDLAFGGIFYSSEVWIGAAVHHVTEPNQSLVGGNAKLPRRVSVHGGYRMLLKGRNRRRAVASELERSITPSFSYRTQGEFDQLDVGAFVTLEPLLLGVWYRGIPVRQLDGVANSESIVLMMGITQKRTSIGYSYDYTISDLGIGTGGAHEISFAYSFDLSDPRKPPLEARRLPCPLPFVF